MGPDAQVAFVVPGPPVPKMRVARYQGRGVTEVRTRQYEALVRFCGLRARPKAWPLDGAYTLSCAIFYPDARWRDLSNVVKSIEDGLNGVLYADDHQIVRYLDVTSGIDRKAPRVEVTLVHTPALKLTLAKCKGPL